MKKITIKIPKSKEDKWMLGIGARPRSMLRADTLINRLIRALPLWLKVNGKTTIKVLEYEDSSWTNVNESLASEDINYLIYTASCFLEDYLSQKTMNRIEKDYLERGD